MKLKKMVKELQGYLDAGTRERKNHRDEMKLLLQKMKAKEKMLSAMALEEFDKEKLQRLRKDIDMVHAQRKKGIAALKELIDKKN